MSLGLLWKYRESSLLTTSIFLVFIWTESYAAMMYSYNLGIIFWTSVLVSTFSLRWKFLISLSSMTYRGSKKNITSSDMEEGNIKIYPQHLPCWPFSDFYYHHLCLAHMSRLAVRSSATQGIPGNGWTRLDVYEGHGSVSWSFFWCISPPPSSFPAACLAKKMTQCAIIPDSSIIASNFAKWEEKGPHRNLIFSRISLVYLLMVLKEYPV